MVRVRDQLKVTTVVVTHDMRTARRVGQRVLMLHDKKIYASGTRTNFLPRKTRWCDNSLTASPIRRAYALVMEKSRLETKVGLFVVLGLALLATLLILFSKAPARSAAPTNCACTPATSAA